MGIFGEFKKFIMRGNVVDMAVGVVVGGAFKSIIDSLVQDLIMPVISTLTGKINIAELSVKVTEELTIPYGNFLQQVLNFLIIAFALFCTVKAMNTVKDKMLKKEEAEEKPAPPTKEEQLLTEIRDLLKKQD